MKKLESSLFNMVAVLVVVALIMAGLLAIVNHVTEAPIRLQAEKALADGIKTVLGSDNLNVTANDTIRKESISYFPEGEGAISDRPYLGIIGNNIWSNYNMILDVRDSLLWIRRFKPDNPPGPFYDFGFRNRTDICRGWIVSRLTRDGDAVGGGMQLGDTIIAVNGRSVADSTWDEEYSIEDNPLLHLDLVGADGKEKHIVLESKEWW